MEIAPHHADRLRRAYAEMGALLTELGILDPAPRPPEPKWVADTAKQWGLIHAASQVNDGDMSADEWSRLGRQHGYDPRGLGGFFQGQQPLMGRQGKRRVLTEHGRRFIERWRADFAA
jgi:hypothetical protein